MSQSEYVADIRRWLNQTDDGGSFEWHAAMSALGCIQAELPGWQPIKTAPKNGVDVIGYDGTLFVCHWVQMLGWCAGPTSEAVHPTEWMPAPPIPKDK